MENNTAQTLNAIIYYGFVPKTSEKRKIDINSEREVANVNVQIKNYTFVVHNSNMLYYSI